MTPGYLLKYLPAYQNYQEVIHQDQDVNDIIKEVIEAHNEFTWHYDSISSFFISSSAVTTAKKLFDFLKSNIAYKVESDKHQTTRSPAAILAIGSGDCKHYAGFIAGVLSSLQRKGAEIDWKYRFASYDLLNSSPGHVFVVINQDGDEIWIDPVLETFNERLEPYYITDKSVKMLSRLSGIEYDYYDPQMYPHGLVVNHREIGSIIPGLNSVQVVKKSTGGDGISENPYFPGPFLGLSDYIEDGGSTAATSWNNLAAQINTEIALGPDPGHQVDGNFVKFIYDNNMKGWNFYYYGGVPVGYDPSSQLPPHYPRVIITADGRLTFDRDVKLDDAHNNEIHAVWGHVQDLINRFDTEDAQPMKPAVLKGFSQGKFGGITGGNLFIQYRGSSIFQQVGSFLEDAVNFVKDVGLKIIGSIPRNAFLGLVGVNAFGMATSLQKRIDSGLWDHMADTWKSLGGAPDKLFNTIQDGKSKNAILGGIGEVTSVSAMLAAAAPIIAIMLKYLDKDGKMTEVLGAAKTFLAQKYPDLDLTDYGFLDRKTGKPVNIIIDDKDNENLGGGNNAMPGDGPMKFLQQNPLAGAFLAAGLTYYLARKNKNVLLYSAGAGAAVFMLTRASDNSSNLTKTT